MADAKIMATVMVNSIYIYFLLSCSITFHLSIQVQVHRDYVIQSYSLKDSYFGRASLIGMTMKMEIGVN